jgi:hypothetical protein
LIRSIKYFYFYSWLLTASAFSQVDSNAPPAETQPGHSEEELSSPDGQETPSTVVEPVPAEAPQTEDQGSVKDAASLQEKEVTSEPATKPNDDETPEAKSEREREEERRHWSTNTSVGYSRLTDNVNSSQSLSYSTGLSRRSDDHSNWGLGVSFGQDGKLRDDPTFDAISWSRGFAFNKDDPHEISYAYSGGLLDPQKIGTQGYRLQNSLALKQNIYVEGGLTILARASTFFLLTEYQQTVTGQEYTRFGLGEAVIANYAYKKVSLTVSFGFDQGYRGNEMHFTNSNSESVDYSFDSNWGIGMSHGISTLVLDPVAKGTQPNILLGDAENSQISFYVGYSR